jgi:hypothetical protein
MLNIIRYNASLLTWINHPSIYRSITFKKVNFCRSITTGFVPFKISREKSHELFLNSASILESKNNSNTDSLIVSNSDPVQQCFIPFYTASITNLASHCVGRYGIDHTHYYTTFITVNNVVIPQVHSYTVTSWRSFTALVPSINYPLGTIDTQIYAGFKFNSNYIESCLRMADIRNIIPYSQLKIKNNNVKLNSFDMKINNGLNKIVTNVTELETTRCENYILSLYNADRVEINKIHLKLNESNMSLYAYHVPAFVYERNNIYKFLNGVNGALTGRKHYSIWKTSLIGGSVASTIGYLLLPPQIKIALLIPKLVTIAITSTTVTGAMTHVVNIYSGNREADQIHNNIKINKNYETISDDTDLDNIIKNLNTDSNNKNTDNGNNKKTNYNYVSTKLDHYTILGLSEKNKLTEKLLKQAFIKQIKMWHPDIYQGDKNIALRITQQINEAYNTLKKTL